MQRQWVRRLITSVYRLELYEILGIVMSTAAVVVFFAFATKLDRIIGVRNYHWKVVNAVVGMYQNLLPWVFTGAFALLFILLWCLQRRDNPTFHKLTFIVRVLIAFCTMMAIYKIVNFYISVFNPYDRDLVLQQIDRTLFFGKLPSEWMVAITWKPLTYLLSLAYMSWFVLTYATILVMLTHSRQATVEFVFTAMSTFYIGYLTYILVPAVGPIHTVHFAEPMGGIASVFTHDQTLLARDCFPSLHTGISVVMLVYVWRYRRKWLWLYGPMTFLIVWSTMYLRFHYGIDVIAGAALATAMTQLCPLATRWWEQRRAAVALDAAVETPIFGSAAKQKTTVSELA
jgi:membrane-associated phospholipid phosphatase